MHLDGFVNKPTDTYRRQPCKMLIMHPFQEIDGRAACLLLAAIDPCPLMTTRVLNQTSRSCRFTQTSEASNEEIVATLNTLWEQCLKSLHEELSLQQYNTWIRPLHPVTSNNNNLVLLAPNRYVCETVNENFLFRINEIISSLANAAWSVSIKIGSSSPDTPLPLPQSSQNTARQTRPQFGDIAAHSYNNVNPNFSFDSFVEGKSNQLARAAATQVAYNPGHAYNPLSIYGGVGLGKTHLMHAIGQHIHEVNPSSKILYLHSERFVADMIKALQRNEMNEFKRFYRSLDVLLIDDIQFLAGKERSQEEFFHTFNTLLDNQQQIVLTCDRYPKEIHGLEERLQSRFGWGLTVFVEPPELETRVAILITKAEQLKINLSQEVAFFIAKHIQSNVRELEGALKRVVANSQFTGQAITVEFTQEALKDLLTLQAKLITIENIQKTAAQYYKIKISDLLSKRRNRSIARPRQMAMVFAKELTNHSLPEIGEAFGGRDHTTVLHACRTIKNLLKTSPDLAEDYKNLVRILSG